MTKKTPLTAAVEKGYESVVKLLIGIGRVVISDPLLYRIFELEGRT